MLLICMNTKEDLKMSKDVKIKVSEFDVNKVLAMFEELYNSEPKVSYWTFVGLLTSKDLASGKHGEVKRTQNCITENDYHIYSFDHHAYVLTKLMGMFMDFYQTHKDTHDVKSFTFTFMPVGDWGSEDRLDIEFEVDEENE